jgi:hypothetical protein
MRGEDPSAKDGAEQLLVHNAAEAAINTSDKPVSVGHLLVLGTNCPFADRSEALAHHLFTFGPERLGASSVVMRVRHLATVVRLSP